MQHKLGQHARAMHSHHTEACRMLLLLWLAMGWGVEVQLSLDGCGAGEGLIPLGVHAGVCTMGLWRSTGTRGRRRPDIALSWPKSWRGFRGGGQF